MPNATVHAKLPRLDCGLALNGLVDAALKLLVEANDPANGTPRCYLRGGKIVRVHFDEDERPRPVEITEAGLAVELDRIMSFYSVTMSKQKDGQKKTQDISKRPPKDVIQGILTSPRIRLPRLSGITESPVLRPDGTVLCRQGYDAATGLVYMTQDPRAFPDIPDNPTDADVRDAFASLADILCDFPFHSQADRANAFAALLTSVVRPAIRGYVPLAAADAPKQGNGKSLFAAVCSVLATGRAEGSITEAKDDEEWRKKITAVLQVGRAVAVIDNVRRDLDSGQLASLLTKDIWEDRWLGKNEIVSLPATTTWLATGNNLRFGGDMIRRVYRIRLDAQQARPWTRGESSYRHPDLLMYVQEQRSRLLAAALTIGRAWFARGCPQGAGVPAFASFNVWARTLGGMLSLGGITDFLGNLTELWDAADDEADEWEPFLRAWVRVFGDKPVTAKQVYTACVSGISYGGSQLFNFEQEGLSETLPGKLREDLDAPGSFKKKLGWALKHHIDTRFGDAAYRVELAGKDQHTNSALWRVLHDEQADRGFSAGFAPHHNGHDATARGDVTADLSPLQPGQSEEAWQ